MASSPTRHQPVITHLILPLSATPRRPRHAPPRPNPPRRLSTPHRSHPSHSPSQYHYLLFHSYLHLQLALSPSSSASAHLRSIFAAAIFTLYFFCLFLALQNSSPLMTSVHPRHLTFRGRSFRNQTTSITVSNILSLYFSL